MFKPVGSKVSFPELEEQVLQFWRERDIFHQVDQVRKDADVFTLYEGPPTANGRPGIHHVLARVFKDVIPRYKTMQGFRPIRKGGWDTHGLPVELEVEKELGFTTKRQIEEYGIEKFNARCRESVMRYVKDWEELTERIGFWIDMPNAYVTFQNDYIETGWWMLKQLWDRGLVEQGYKVAPHCPRCVTTLSSHEVALGYREDTPDPSVFVKFEMIDASKGPHVLQQSLSHDTPAYLLAWTTTPWTLPGNVALAVAAQVEYALVELTESGDRLVLASALAHDVLNSEHRVLATFRGRELVGVQYRPLFNPGAFAFWHARLRDDGALDEATITTTSIPSYPVVAADFVSTEDGTGIVHIAPAFGQEDFDLGRQRGLWFVQPVDQEGQLDVLLSGYLQENAGLLKSDEKATALFVKKADPLICQDLQQRGLLYRAQVIRHTYPFCWRCDSPLLYYAKASWYLKTTAVKERLISGNQEINWFPEHVKEGRFGEWLRNNVDWALSRERYWGTPIPIWQCAQCGQYECFGSVAELRERALPEHRALLDPERLDLHRPYVDQIAVRCQRCGGEMRRIPEVMDCWFDSGAMPFAQEHVMSEGDLATLRREHLFPADYICEAVDQTRGWFYTLHALSTFIAGGPCYRNVICLGLILDAKGEKMSKSKGNVVEPWPVIRQHGADALRWYLFTAAPPGNARRFSAELVGDSVRRFLLPLWNVYSFFVTYANLDGFNPASGPAVIPSSDMDRWALSELQQTVDDVTRLLDAYNPTDAGRRIEEFVDILSNWYVRRSRRRFWKSEDDEDKWAAYTTLYTCLATLTRLLAPFTPFVAEEMYGNLVRSVDPQAPESVHLAEFPVADPALADRELSEAMELAMRVASLGRAARSKAGIRVRQPLAEAVVNVPTDAERASLLRVQELIKDELNIKAVKDATEVGDVIRFEVRLNLHVVGPKYGKQVGAIARQLVSMNASDVALLKERGRHIDVGGFSLLPDEILVNEIPQRGYAFASEGGYSVAVTTELTPALADEGLARELVHRLQNLRRTAGFEIDDRIITWYAGDSRLRRVMEHHGDYIRQETLSQELREGEPEPGAHVEEQKLEGLTVKLAVRRAVQ